MDPVWLPRLDQPRLAVRHRHGTGPTILFLPGYASDMLGTKAVALDALAEWDGVGLLRFDYRGTGESEGRFEAASLRDWIEDAEAVAALVEGPLILVGSSMGGWIMGHLAQRLRNRVVAMVGIAAAPDFTDWGYSPAEKMQLAAGNDLLRPNPYGGDAALTTARFWASGEDLHLLDAPIPFIGPVRLLHGDSDAEVPLDIAFRFKDALASDDVHVTVVKAGTHRMSGPGEIALLERTIRAILAEEARRRP